MSLGHPCKFQPPSRLGFVTAPTSLNGGQQNFAGCFAVSCAGTLYMHFGALALTEILPAAKFTLRPSLAFSYIDRVTARHSTSGSQPIFVAVYQEWNYGTFADGATYIRLGGHHVAIGPHSSFCTFRCSTYCCTSKRKCHCKVLNKYFIYFN